MITKPTRLDTMVRLVSRYIPASIHAEGRFEATRAGSVVWLAWGAAAALALGAAAREIGGALSTVERLVFTACFLTWLAVPSLLRRGVSVSHCARLILVPATLAMALTSVYTGGIDTPSMVWLSIAPLAAALVAGSAVALDTLLLTASLQIAFFAGWIPTVHHLGGDTPVDWFTNLFMVSVVSVGVAYFFEQQVSAERIALIDAQASFQLLADEMHAAVIMIGGDGEARYANHRANDLLASQGGDQPLHEVLGVDLAALVRSGERATIRQARFGQMQVIELGARPITFLRRSCTLVTLVDRTVDWLEEQRRAQLQARLQQAEKLEGLGMMAGGVAHDFNNLLTPLKVASATLLNDPTDVEEVRACAEDIREATRRAEELVQGIRVYAGQSSPVLTDVSVDATLHAVVTLLSVGSEARVSVQRGKSGPCFARATDGLTRQIFENLLKNALDAVASNGGTVTVDIGELRVDDDAEHVDASCLPTPPAPGDYVYIDVIDTGVGISVQHRPRLFDPFFTTKAHGQGLGLSRVFGAVRQLGGGLLLYSELGLGARFRVLLKRGAAPSAEPVNDPSGSIARGDGELLVVDDEPLVLRQLVRVLEHGGWTVTATSDPLDALARLTAEPERFQAAVVDFLMPVLNGTQLAGRLHVIRPDLPIVLCSGYIEESSRVDFEQAGFHAVVHKPFEPATLQRTVLASIAAGA